MNYVPDDSKFAQIRDREGRITLINMNLVAKIQIIPLSEKTYRLELWSESMNCLSDELIFGSESVAIEFITPFLVKD